MEELKLERQNGCLNLDDYFIKRLGRSFIDEEDLIKNRCIELEPNCSSNPFWVLDENHQKIALFKEQAFGTDEAYAELIGEEVAKVLEIPTAHYDLASFQGKKGVISYNFIGLDDTFYNGEMIMADFYENRLQNNRELRRLYDIKKGRYMSDDLLDELNNLEDIWSILDHRYHNYPNKDFLVKRFMDRLVDKLVFDILMVNVDDHCNNWGIMDELEEGKIISPQYDNGRILSFHKNILIEKLISKNGIKDEELRLVVDRSSSHKPLDVLERFLQISSSEYSDYILDKVEKLEGNLDQIPIQIEKRTACPMPNYLKSYFVDTTSHHLNDVKEVIYKNTKGSK